jgi:DNA modification methylase
MTKVIEQASGDMWTMFQGDCCEVIAGIPDDSIDFGIHSPPFANLYIYSDSMADMGNAANSDEFFEHYSYLIRELFRTTVPGRLCAVHCKDLPLYFNRDGAAGLDDFPGDIIRAFSACGWTYHSRVTIWKDPVIEMQRTKNNGLLHKTLCRDSSQVRQGMADYLLVFRKITGDSLMSDKPVTRNPSSDFTGDEKAWRRSHCFSRYVGSKDAIRIGSYCVGGMPDTYGENGNNSEGFGLEVWQRYASPVWFDISQTRVLNYRLARDEQDEKHICPLQLDVIERSVELWTNPEDVVLSPFAGVGSEGVGSISCGRRFVGIELKDSYFAQAVGNLKVAESKRKADSKLLF